MYINGPEREFMGLGGDLLVIEGLDKWEDHWAQDRRGPYWGPGAQYLPGFPPAHRMRSVDYQNTFAINRYTIPDEGTYAPNGGVDHIVGSLR